MSTCAQCKYSIMTDYGYSNYTVEGTTFSCARRLHPLGEFDRFYGENPKLNYANECVSFVEGDGMDQDVDGEWESNLSEDHKATLKIMEMLKIVLNEQ